MNISLFFFKKISSSFVTFILITLVVFVVVKIAPGNPFSIYESSSERAISKMSPLDYQSLREKYDLDKPILWQYKKYLFSLFQFSLGDSFSERRPVYDVIIERLPNTIFLNLFSLFIALIISLPSGSISALKKDSIFDRSSQVLFYGLYALPSYWVSILFILFFGVYLKWFPFFGMHGDNAQEMGFLTYFLDFLYHAFLPSLCLALSSLAFFSRFTRSTLLEVIKMDYIKTAKAKGASKNTLFFRHILRSALIPFVTLFGLILPEMVAGSVIIESIFSWPGLGQLYLKAVYTRDYPVIMALSVIGATLVLIGSMLTDILYYIVDPRTRKKLC